MSYQVLARKWRPNNFKALLGQEHVSIPLTNALTNNRLHHAYLFTGTRGVGKTTVARILAKCLNCETGVTAKPCNKCNACVQINSGAFVDLIEVDAASRTKVEDTRELLNNVQYLPTNARYKIYLIDEVHMLSGHSFNALLKTLEEPPEHVKFLLATTDPQKLPITVLSRCLQFHLKNLTINTITQNLQYILEQENIQFEIGALTQIAKAANGSMRDALSILDQAIAFGNNSVSNVTTTALLGSIDQKYIINIINAIINNDHKAIINATNDLAEFTFDFEVVLDEIIDVMHKIAIYQINLPIDDCNQEIVNLSKKINKKDLHAYYQVLLAGKKDLYLHVNQKIGFEMILLRSTFAIDNVAHNATVPLQKNIPSVATKNEDAQQDRVKKITAESAEQKNIVINWNEVLQKLKAHGALYTIACNCEFKNFTNNNLELVLNENHDALLSPNMQIKLTKEISNILNNTISLKIKSGKTTKTFADVAAKKKLAEKTASLNSIKSDQAIQNLMNEFDATIVDSGIKPRS